MTVEEVVAAAERFDRAVTAFRDFAKAGDYEFRHQKYADGKRVVVVECWYKPKVDGRK